jgi:dTMP kinase
MDEQGLLIAFDGLDSSGKATQAYRLVERLRYNGFVVHQFQTPDYTTDSGKELKLRLQNKLGNWEDTPWQEKMAYFARNRAEHRAKVQEALRSGDIVIYDRYIPSSLAFMTVEALNPQETELRRSEIYQAVEKEEYETQDMPREDVSVFLDIPPLIAAALLEKRKEKLQDENEYTDHLHVQERLYNEYDFMCTDRPDHFLRIRCVEGEELLGVEAVSELVWEGLTHRFSQLHRKS